MIVASLLAGCASSFDYHYTPKQEQALIGEVLGSPPVEPPASPLFLSDAAKHALEQHVKKSWSDERKVKVLRDFMFDKNQLHITYKADTTKTALQVWNSRSGNCLSMANLFIAGARYLGLDAKYETVDVDPTWDEQGSTIVRYEHIIAAGELMDGQQYVVDFLPTFQIGDRKSQQITDRQAVALYYSNLGAESLIAGRFERAIAELRRAIRIHGGLSDAWNNLGAAFRRTGRMTQAEFAYQRAVHLDADNYSALTNLAQFYQSQGKAREAEYFAKRINAYRRRNPYYHYMLARKYYRAGEYKKAIAALRAAVRLKRNEPAFYVALAQSYAKVDKLAESKRYEALAKKYRKPRAHTAPSERSYPEPVHAAPDPD